MVRELTDEEIDEVYRSLCDYEGAIDPVQFARELFEAARVQQNPDGYKR